MIFSTHSRFSHGLARTVAGLVCVMSLIGASASSAAPSDETLGAMGSAYWRRAAQVDVQAAHGLIAENHPAMLAEVKDQSFRDAEAKALQIARERADRVNSYDGYSATLAAYAVALKDAHIWSRPTFVIGRPEWAGIVMAKRARKWLVVDEELDDSNASLLGAELISCDGVPPEKMADEKLGGFRVDWTVGAQQTHAAPWLLIDDHNPFVMRPKACSFAVGGKVRSVTLQWRLIKRDALIPRLNAAIGAGAAGFGIRKAGTGYWISLQSLLDSAAPVVAEVEARATELREAPFVVVDLRGNTGGSSEFGTRIAQALMGPAYVAAKIPDDDSCDEVWRTSPGNVAQLTYYRDVMGPTHGPQFTETVSKLLAKAVAARAADRSLSGPAECPSSSPVKTAAHAPPSLLRGKLIVVTDSLCFSSCLVVTHDLLALGALQVGQTTDANTHYSEVREVEMPSGLSKFSTLQAYSPGTPIRYGPFVPSIPYPGDMSDTAAVQAWVLAQAARS